MAELTTDPTPASPRLLFAPEAQASCCEPSEKDALLRRDDRRGELRLLSGRQQAPSPSPRTFARPCARSTQPRPARPPRSRARGRAAGPIALTDADRTQVFGAALYSEAETEGATATAVAASLGCGVPTAVADLREGETVLDLGSGAGADVLISARRVGPTGKAIGLDMTDEMLELARANAAHARVENVEFVKGYIEAIPLADDSVDVIVSNCVLNLSGDKPKVLAEAARVLRPGGRFAVSDVIASPDMDDATRADLAAYTGCIAGALTEEEFRDGLTAAGFVDVEIRDTHRVHEFASSAVIRARKPEALAFSQTIETGSLPAMSTLDITHVTPECPPPRDAWSCLSPRCAARRGCAARRWTSSSSISARTCAGPSPRARRWLATTCPQTPTRLSPTRRSRG